MNLNIPSKDDKDAQIEYLKNALADVKKALDENCYMHDYNDYEVEVNCIEAADVRNIEDFIDKRLLDLCY